MGVEIVTEFVQKTTVRVRAEVRDDDDTLVDATTSINMDLWDKSGTKVVDDVAMTPISTGIYESYYNLASDAPKGYWRGIVWVTDGTKVSEGSFGFKVKA